jgi:L-lactate dehydrogenase (cytochrome)
MSSPHQISLSELRSHASSKSCWIVVHKKVWDITSFLPSHPGGPEIILQYAGADATSAYDEIHAPGIISSTLPPSKLLGYVSDADLASLETDKPTASPDQPAAPSVPSTAGVQREESYVRPPLSAILNAADFEEVAQKSFTPKAWAFYSSAATDLISHRLNNSIYSRVLFRPRVLRNVTNVSTHSKILDIPVSLPIFIAPCAMARLAHPDGELAQARGAKAEGILQAISTNASFPLAEIVDSISTTSARSQDSAYPFFLQLYVNKSRAQTASLLHSAVALGVKAIFLTVDCPVAGKREADERLAHDVSLRAPNSEHSAATATDAKGGGLARLMGQFIDASLSWEDIAWVNKCLEEGLSKHGLNRKIPIILKGIQTASDARHALQYVNYGVRGLVLSNHGGRSLDTSPPALITLLECWKLCPEIFDRFEIFIDGGIRRGTDVVKALCLGATAVGIGRPFLYAVGYGEDGVRKLVDLFRDEIEVTMKMLGVTSIEELGPELLNTRDVDSLVPDWEVEKGHPYVGRVRRELKKLQAKL